MSFWLLLANGVSAQAQSGDVVISADTTWEESVYDLNSLTVNNGATLTIAGGSTLNVVQSVTVTGSSRIVLQGKNNVAQVEGQWVGMGVTIYAADIQIGSGSQISADGCGYGPFAGPGGGGSYVTGGTYGGQGHDNPLPVYGSYLLPADLGSGGGAAFGGTSSGGGAIRLNVTGTLTNNGTITADGYASMAGNTAGGSGGSIYVTAGTIAGSGTFTANGGTGTNGSGGGGRVAIYFTANGGFDLTSITADGGDSESTAGTTYLLENGANLHVPTNLYLPADTAASYTNVTVFNGVRFTVGGGSGIVVSGALTVTGNSTMLLLSKNNIEQVGGQWQGAGVTINAGTIQVDAGSKISAEGTGYYPSCGPGGGGSYVIGGTHGGQGSGNTLPTYGSYLAPTDLGSGGGAAFGGWSSGGGAIRLIVSGTLTNSGAITANGYATIAGNTAGGSGGSIYITTGTIAGSGTVTADGGVGTNGYGGGGRIAIYYTINNGFNPALVTANGGGTGASAGTAYLLQNSTDLYVTSNLYLPPDTSASYANITVANGALLTLGGGSNITASSTLLITGNSTILVQSKNSGGSIGGFWQGAGGTINAGDLQVDAGSRISADGQGYGPYLGPGGGTGYTVGGTHGGRGTDSSTPIYGSAFTPTDLGSGGGAAYGGTSSGGGAIRLIVSGTLTNNGTITANGYATIAGNTAGGSGGSIYVTTGTIAGSGTVTADGGVGTNGYGGGGRIAVYYTTNSAFNPDLLTANAGGATAEPGSVVFIDTLANGLEIPGGQLVLAQDSSLSFNDISLDSGALLILWGGSTLNAGGTLSIAGNATISVRSKDNAAQVAGQWVGQGATIIASNLTVASGGTISADAQGYSTSQGPGGAPHYLSGGTYGGRGSDNPLPTYGSALATTDLGSGGGGAFGGWSAGGGAIRLLVSGTLTNNGTVTAKGYATIAGNTGGGAGGSIYLTTGTIAGNGTFTANGGTGTNGYGGGGRIAIYYENGGFNLASMTANGGGGSAEAGTVSFIQIVRVTVNTSMAGISFTVDGSSPYYGEQTFTWEVGSAHTIATASPQAGAAGTQYAFSAWSDGGGVSHGVTAAAATKTYLATFTTQYQLTAAVSPPSSGTVTPVSGGFYDSGTVVNLVATQGANFQFYSWSGPVADGNAASTTVTMSAPQSVTAYFVPVVDVTVTTNPAGLHFTVDGSGYTNAQAFRWVVGSNHGIATTSPQGSGGTRYVFVSWSDSGPLSHSVPVPASPITIIAAFTTQYQLTTASVPSTGGSISAVPDSTDGFYDSPASVQLTATASAGFTFAGWTGGGCTGTGICMVAMSEARNVTANFDLSPRKPSMDFNGDSIEDALLYNAAAGNWSEYAGSGAGFAKIANGWWSPGWQISPADFNGDSITDLFLYNPGTGYWYKAIGNGAGYFTYYSGQWSPGWEVHVAELNGDGRSDIFLYHPTLGIWYRCISPLNPADGFIYSYGYWLPDWTVHTVDWNGDGKTDLFLYSKATGSWYQVTNIDPDPAAWSYSSGSWMPGWDMYPGDFNGDGKADLFLYMPGSGAWYVAMNTGSGFSYTAGYWAPGWSIYTGDFNGDAATDIFVYSTATGQWYQCISNLAGYFSAWYTGNWSPVWQVQVEDFNHDGKADVLVHYPDWGVWYLCITQQTAGTFAYYPGTWDPGMSVVIK